MNYPLEPNIHWTDHFVKYGFAVLRDQLEPDFIEAALQRVRVYAGSDLPFDEWTLHNTRRDASSHVDDVFRSIYEQPKIRELINTMYGASEIGSPLAWSGKRHSPLFLNPFDPNARTKKPKAGHVDFGHELIPVLGSGFSFHALLRETEPSGGNYTIWPRSHVKVQKMVMENPNTYAPDDFVGIDFGEPFEFYGKSGDLIVIHHLAMHTATPCSGPTKKPRIGLHTQAPRTTWLKEVDPDKPNMCPWERSMTLNGRFDAGDNERRVKEYIASKKTIQGKWAPPEGQPVYEVFRWHDGAVKVKSALPPPASMKFQRPRFDGRRMTFEQIFDPEAARCAEMVFNRAGEPLTSGVQYRATLELDPADHDRMTCTLSEASSHRPMTATLFRAARA